jgi:hypothetical protein
MTAAPSILGRKLGGFENVPAQGLDHGFVVGLEGAMMVEISGGA